MAKKTHHPGNCKHPKADQVISTLRPYRKNGQKPSKINPQSHGSIWLSEWFFAAIFCSLPMDLLVFELATNRWRLSEPELSFIATQVISFSLLSVLVTSSYWWFKHLIFQWLFQICAENKHRPIWIGLILASLLSFSLVFEIFNRLKGTLGNNAALASVASLAVVAAFKVLTKLNGRNLRLNKLLEEALDRGQYSPQHEENIRLVGVVSLRIMTLGGALWCQVNHKANLYPFYALFFAILWVNLFSLDPNWFRHQTDELLKRARLQMIRLQTTKQN